ncbi:ubiquitin-related domain-containing protein, partial [Hyaloraphidium curvatum]
SGPPRRRTDDPRAAAARFLLDFEQKYGRQHPEFFQGTYNQALDAAKRDLKYFLAVLQSEEHDDTEAFTRQVLCSERVCTFLRENNFVIWGGNIKESEAFQVSGILEATRYPFMAMIAPHSSQMRIFDRIEGPTTADALVDRLSRRIATLAPQLEGIRRQRREREEATRLREQQDRAYRESLRADEEKQERLRQEEEERERAEREERERQSKQRSKAEMRAAAQEKWASLAEPTGPGTTKLSVKLPSGARVVRRFEDGEKIETVYDFVLSQDLDPIPLESDFVLVGTYPRREFTDMAATLKDVGLVPNGAVLVEEAVPDE